MGNLSRAEEIMDLGREPIATSLLDQHTSLLCFKYRLHFKYLPLSPDVSVVLTSISYFDIKVRLLMVSYESIDIRDLWS